MLSKPLLLLAASALIPMEAVGDDVVNAKVNLGSKLIQLGGAASTKIWTTSESKAALAKYPNDEVYQLAIRVQTDINNAKASSAVLTTFGQSAAAGLQLAAVVDPEPISKISLGIAAFATQAATDQLAAHTYGKAQATALGMYRKALEQRSNQMTAQRLNKMSTAELVAGVDSLKLGTRTMRQIFVDNPEALELIKANLVDYLVDQGAGTLLTVKKIDGDIAAAHKAVVKVADELKTFRKASIAKLNTIDQKTSEVLQATKESAQQLAALRVEVRGNSRAIQALSDISYLGWTTEQKLAAVNTGQFPELNDSERGKLSASLRSELKREALIKDLQIVGRDLGSLTTLAENLGLPKQLVSALNTANIANTAILKFASGDVIGSVASLSGLFAKQRSDPAAERHQQLMKFLSEQFGQINERLGRIQRLQEDTLAAVLNLSEMLTAFRNETHQQLVRIEQEVLANSAMLQEIIRAEWRPCRAMRDASNQRPWFSTRQEILDVLGTSGAAQAFRANWRTCNTLSYNFLNGDILTGSWTGGIADLTTAGGPITSNPDEQTRLRNYANQRSAEYRAARDLVLVSIPDLYTSPARYLIRIGQPVPTTGVRDTLAAIIKAQHTVIDGFKCNTSGILSPGQRKLACLSIPSGSAEAPLPQQVERMFGDALIGPNGWALMDSVIGVSRTAALTRINNNDETQFLSPADLALDAPPSVNLLATIRERRGIDLLQALTSMAELNILQQSIAYGDFAPQLALDVLYDPSTRMLRAEVDSNASPEIKLRQAKALAAMRINPSLGRNVVMLAVRNALRDASGNFPMTYYGLAIENFRGVRACTQDPVGMQKLASILPGWKLEYRIERQAVSAETATCKVEDDNIARGAGLVLDFGNFYVRMPSTEIASNGIFEYPQSLAIALGYRATIGQELVDRNVHEYFKSRDDMKLDFLNFASKLR